MDSLTLFNTLSPIIKGATGIPNVIVGDQNKGAPPGPYAAVRVKQQIAQRGQANIRYKNATGPNVDADVFAQITVQCSINFYREGALDYAQKMHQANKKPTVSIALFKAGIGWNRSDPVNNLTSLQSSNLEERAQVSIYLMYESSDAETINSIESVTVEVQNEKADVLKTITVESPDAP